MALQHDETSHGARLENVGVVMTCRFWGVNFYSNKNTRAVNVQVFKVLDYSYLILISKT